jgi:hypothetical protein
MKNYRFSHHIHLSQFAGTQVSHRCTDKEIEQTFPHIQYKEIQKGSGA